MRVQYETMTPSEMVKARARRPVAYLPLGILEWHGPHLPLGLDALKAHALCCRFAERTGGVVFPTFWYGDNRDQVAEVHFDPNRIARVPRDMRDDIAAALGVSKDGFVRNAARAVEQDGWRLFQELFTQTLWQIDALGFRAIVALCGHYPLSPAAAPVAEAFNQLGRARVLAATEAEIVQERGYRGDHAAKWETSLGLALLGEHVRMDELPLPGGELIGILGPDPRAASAAFGEEAVAVLTEVVAQRVGELLGEAGPGDRPSPDPS
ncbi:MAG: creatininase family protein [Chloroflexi bacterium]|nr:creatininase family protein [Chloroflexota bacterium]